MEKQIIIAQFSQSVTTQPQYDHDDCQTLENNVVEILYINYTGLKDFIKMIKI